MLGDELKDTLKQRFTSKFTLSAQDEEAVLKSATLKGYTQKMAALATRSS